MNAFQLVGCYPDTENASDAVCVAHCPDPELCDTEHAALFAGAALDTPTHCGATDCEEMLPHELTPDGYEYVREALESGDGRPEILAQWREEYGPEEAS